MFSMRQNPAVGPPRYCGHWFVKAGASLDGDPRAGMVTDGEQDGVWASTLSLVAVFWYPGEIIALILGSAVSS